MMLLPYWKMSLAFAQGVHDLEALNRAVSGLDVARRGWGTSRFVT
jgi:hypothetical protein